jgi:hypothetical protein
MANLTLLAFPQFWDGAGTLSVRFLALPSGDPFAPLDLAAAPPFAATELQIEARLVSNPANLPKPTDPATAVSLGAMPRPRRADLFGVLRDKFQVVAPPAAPPGPPLQPRVKKLLTKSYQRAARVTQSRTPFAVTDSSSRRAPRPPHRYHRPTTP